MLSFSAVVSLGPNRVAVVGKQAGIEFKVDLPAFALQEREVVVVGHVGQDAFAVGSAVGLHVHGEGHRTSDVPDCRADDLAAACGGQLRTYLQLGRGERVERRVVAAAGRMPVEVVREQAPVAVGELQPDEMHGREFRRFRVAAVDFHFIERVAPLRGTPESEHSDVAGLLQRQRDRLFAALRQSGVEVADEDIRRIWRQAYDTTRRETHQAMEGFIHNLNTMHSRGGNQVVFSSVNYGTDFSPEGRMVIKNMLLATEEGLGSGETPIFPVQIFRVKEGVNYNPEDPNYDLFKLAMHCSAKRLFPNFSFLDAPFNAQYYKGTPETEIAYMGCRTRVMGNVYDPDREVTPGRGNLSFTSINLPRLAIRAKGDIDLFFDLLDSKLQLVTGQLDERFEIQARKHVYNAPFLMGQGVWIDSEKLSPTDEQREVLKHGTLTTGFIGLVDVRGAPTGQHHGQSAEAQRLGLEIVGHMRSYCDRISKERGMNYTLIATPAEGLSGRFVRIDRERYGVIPGVTDRDYYTNGFHVPVYFDISAFDKIALEAPYHALTNGGHISYIELDGDPSDNLEAFESVIRYMKDCGMGYGSVNHPVDRDPVCGYNGIIEDVCPKCGRTEDEHNQPFERIRRITGYLTGDLSSWNSAKRAEEKDRVKHL